MPVPDPITRKEQFLAAAANGSATNLPDPITREETYLKTIAENSGGGGGGGGSSTLSGLTDVDISNPSDGQTLVYNATSGKWENGAGGGAASGILLVEDNNGTLNKTAAEIAAADYAVLKIVPTDESQNPGDWEYVYAPLNAIFTSDGYYFSFVWQVNPNAVQYLYAAAAGTDYPQAEGRQHDRH